MIRDDFNTLLIREFEQVVNLSVSKGADYAGDVDVFSNFKRHAANLGLTPEQIWAVYAGKHWDAIVTYCKTGQVESEPIQGRLRDLITYSLLLLGMAEEKQDLGPSKQGVGNTIDAGGPETASTD